MGARRPRQALDRLNILGAELERSYPGAAGSLREGIAETLTLTRLGINGSLKRTLASTNPCESMIECVRRTSRNVKRWQSGEMALAGPPRGCSKRNASSAGSSATATSPASPSRSSATLSLAVTPMPDARPTEEVGAAQRRAPVVPFALGKRGRR
jgi:hypothetical protein